MTTSYTKVSEISFSKDCNTGVKDGIRAIRSFEKRKAVFNWLHKSRADVCFLQETYSTLEVVNIW